MIAEEIRVGMRVKITKLFSSEGFIVKEQYLTARKYGLTGVVKGCVLGHRGDIWLITHDDGSVGAYCFDEFISI